MNRWTVRDHQAVTANPFWLATNDGGEIPLEDFVPLLINLPPDANKKAPVWRLSLGEQQSILDCVIDASQKWTFESGRFQPGLREILLISAGVLKREAVHHGLKEMPSIATNGIDNLIVHLVDQTVKFEPDANHWATVFDLGKAFDFFQSFYLRLSALQLRRRPMMGLQAHRLAVQAWKLMTQDLGNLSRRGYLDLIDGELLPWAIVFERVAAAEVNEDAVIKQIEGAAAMLAADRFDLRNVLTLNADEKKEFTVFDYDTVLPEVLTDAMKPRSLSIPGKGSYSFRDSYERGYELARTFGLTSAPVKLPYLDLDLSTDPSDAWKEQTSRAPILINELLEE